MKISHNIILASLLGIALSPVAFADRAAEETAEAASIASVPGANIKIVSPANNAKIDADEEYPLVYEVTPGKGGDHFHIWVDGNRSPGLHDVKGTYTLPKLSPGEHIISLRVVTKDHIATGPEKSIKVIAGAEKVSVNTDKAAAKTTATAY
jgi:hypothetical protein